jgi:MFS family permease
MQTQNPNVPRQGGVLEGVTPYHWLVVIVAACGWVFDVVDMRIFTLAREPALKELLGGKAADAVVKSWSGWATAVMMIGWATGGIIFGMMSDRWGRVKTMVLTLLAYSGFTGLCGLARTPRVRLYRFLVGLGMGGVWGRDHVAGRPAISAHLPGRAPFLSACGNIIGSLLSTQIRPSQPDFLFGYSGWRIIFFVGVLPALLVIPILYFLREPPVWQVAKERSKSARGERRDIGSIPDLFRHPRWRRNMLVGVGLGLAGMAGLWGIGFFSPELISMALKGESQTVIDTVRGYGTALQDVGSLLGMMTFTLVATFVGRRPAFAGSFLLCLITTIFVFNNLKSGTDAY